MTRQFIYKEQVYVDPDPTASPKAVLNMLSLTHPELVNANIVGPTFKGEDVTYEFKTVLGTKG